MNSTFSRVGIAVSLALALAGCGKHEAPVPAASAPAASDGAQGVTPYTGPADIAAGGNCSLDAVNGAAVANAATTATVDGNTVFAGWIGDANGQVPTDALLLLKGADGAYSTPLAAGGPRPDVAAALGKDGLATSGYNLTTLLAGVAPGTYVLSIVHGGAAPQACPLNVTLTVGN